MVTKRIFICVCAFVVLCMASALLSPLLGLGKGDNFLLFIHFGISRSQLIKFMLAALACISAIWLFIAGPYRAKAQALLQSEISRLRETRISSVNQKTVHSYRPDIDGLRAVAIIAVVAFHAFPDKATGGFVGVDVFFVISGYLISGIILHALAAGEFSFKEFYLRRCRRIFPALATMLVASYVVGWYFLTPEELHQLSKHITAGTAFMSNLVFWQETGYFDANTKVLLHLWSLGVEEQFYLIWPLALYLITKKSWNVVLFLLIIATLSFGINIIYVHDHNLNAAFFSPMSRFWELMLGALLASITIDLRSNVLRNILPLVGIVLLYFASTHITKSSDFPGYLALLPTIGAVLIIGAGPQAVLNRYLLANPLFIYIGLISYPLYLWHLPLLTFAQIDAGKVPDVGIRWGIIGLSLLLALLTYRYIETPIRKGSHVSVRKGFALISIMTVICIGGSLTVYNEGIPSRDVAIKRYSGDLWHEKFFTHLLNNYYPCTPGYIRDHSLSIGWITRCVQSKPEEGKDIAIVGDSHAEDLFVGLAEERTDQNVVAYIRNAIPLAETKDYKEIFDYVSKDKRIKTVVLASFWFHRINEVPPTTNLQSELTKTLKGLVEAGKTVYVIDDRPFFPFDPDSCKYAQRRRILFWEKPHEAKCEFPRQEFDEQQAKYRPQLVSAAEAFHNVHYVYASREICDEKRCSMIKNKALLYRERNHLTLEGSRLVAKAIVDKMTSNDQNSVINQGHNNEAKNENR